MNHHRRYLCDLCHGKGVGVFYRTDRRPPTIEPHESCPRCGGKGYLRGHKKRTTPLSCRDRPRKSVSLTNQGKESA